MKNIRALPKYVFDSLFKDLDFSSYKKTCFISILDLDNDENKWNKSDNFLQVRMWDVDKTVSKYELPNDLELKKIVDFINLNKDKDNFIIHCSAGISRSGAVALFIHDKFIDCIDKDKFRRENNQILPNLYILNKLKEFDINI